jgi:hypothetical protein
VLESTGTIWEHYAPESATGEGVKDFVGRSGLGRVALLIENVLGIEVDTVANTVTWRPRLAGHRRAGGPALRVRRLILDCALPAAGP